MPVKFQKNVILAPYTYFKIGGPARYFFVAKNKERLVEALEKARKKNLKVFILAGGTNLLISDQGFDGLVIKLQITNYKLQATSIIAEAGAQMCDLVDVAIKAGLSGMEWAGGLPGTLGGAIRGNAGCFGSEMKKIVKEVISIDKEPPYQIHRRPDKNCQFGYRDSIFKKDQKEIILEAKIVLKPGDSQEIKTAVQKNIEYRSKFHPMEYPSAGSVFKNYPFEKISPRLQRYFRKWKKSDPFPLIPAGIIIKEAGLSGKSVGGAKVSEKHSNFIINTGEAKAKDVKTLMDLCKKTAKEKFGIALEEEIMLVGDF